MDVYIGVRDEREDTLTYLTGTTIGSVAEENKDLRVGKSKWLPGLRER